jgi:hypothetical protein
MKARLLAKLARALWPYLRPLVVAEITGQKPPQPAAARRFIGRPE